MDRARRAPIGPGAASIGRGPAEQDLRSRLEALRFGQSAPRLRLGKMSEGLPHELVLLGRRSELLHQPRGLSQVERCAPISAGAVATAAA